VADQISATTFPPAKCQWPLVSSVQNYLLGNRGTTVGARNLSISAPAQTRILKVWRSNSTPCHHLH